MPCPSRPLAALLAAAALLLAACGGDTDAQATETTLPTDAAASTAEATATEEEASVDDVVTEEETAAGDGSEGDDQPAAVDGETDGEASDDDATTADDEAAEAPVDEPTPQVDDGSYDPITDTLIQLTDPHDEPEFYCVDVRGVGATLDIEAALTAHTCKPGAEDELFDINLPGDGQIYISAYDRCIEAAAAEAGAELFIVECGEASLQRFTFNDDLTITLDDGDEPLCLGVGEEPGEPTGGPSHLRRLLLLVPCAEADESLSTWFLPGPDLA